jgi:hypothetical protein
MCLISLSTSGTDSPLTVSPAEVAAEGLLRLGMAAVVHVVQAELLEGCKVALDPVQPRGARRREVERHAVGCGIGQHDVQDLAAGILAPQPLQEGQERPAVLAFDEPAGQRVGLQVIDPVHVPHAPVSAVGGSMPVHIADSRVVHAAVRQEIQWPKLIDR